MAPAAAGSGNVNKAQVKKAVEALLAHVERTQAKGGKAQLLDFNVPINIIIALKGIPQTNGRTKPYMISLKHSMWDPEETQVCLITKDPQREYKDKLEQKGIKSVQKVIGIGKLRTKYKQYEAKRQLCGQYDVFLADDRIIPLLPHLIGKVFFEKKKQPLPLRLTRQDWEQEIQKLLCATPFYLSEGLCSAVKAGHTQMTPEQLVENIMLVVEKVASVIPKGWDGIQALNIKTHDSIALPIYNAMPGNPYAPEEKPAKSGSKSGEKRKADEPSEAANKKAAKIVKKEESEESPRKPSIVKKEESEESPRKPSKPQTPNGKEQAVHTPNKKSSETPKAKTVKAEQTSTSKPSETPKAKSPKAEVQDKGTKLKAKPIAKTSSPKVRVTRAKAKA